MLIYTQPSIYIYGYLCSFIISQYSFTVIYAHLYPTLNIHLRLFMLIYTQPSIYIYGYLCLFIPNPQYTFTVIYTYLYPTLNIHLRLFMLIYNQSIYIYGYLCLFIISQYTFKVIYAHLYPTPTCFQINLSRFHLRNGSVLYGINWFGNPSRSGISTVLHEIFSSSS